MIKLKPYQPPVKDKSVEILKTLGLVYMVLDPRLGKTKTSWATFEEMGAEEVTFLTTLGAKTDILPQFKEIGEPFKLRLYHNDEMPKLLSDPTFAPSKYLIIDEGHAHGKFPEPSQRATYCLEFVERARKAHGEIYIIILSGTPCPENYVQLYHQFNFASPNPLGTIDEFLRDYVEVKIKKLYLGFNAAWGKQQIREVEEYHVNAEKLFGILDKYIVSLTQEQAGFKVKPVDIMHHIDMSLPIYRYIHHISNTGTLQIGEHAINAKKGSSLKSKIHQLSGGTILLTDEEKKKSNKYLILDETKIKYIKKTFEGKKIVIFYQFRAEEELIKMHFPNWTNSQHEFNESNDKVLIGQFKSIREGVDASTADCLVMYNIDYSSRTYRQARMRHIFFERERPGEIHWIFTRNGLEDLIYEKVMNKQEYTDTCFDSDLTFFRDNNPAQLELF